MAYIEKIKLKSGKLSYRARVRQSGSPDKSANFPTRTDAVKWAQRMEAEIRAGRYFGREEDKEKTFNQLVERYIEKELPKNSKSFKKQKQLLSWWNGHLGCYYLCHITPGMIAELRDKLMSEITRRGKLRTSSTANRYLAALSKAFEICWKEWHWMKSNPVSQIRKPKENKARERFLSEEEIEVLLTICKRSKSPHLYAVVLFALSTGARKGEIVNLLWEDVDIFRSTARFRDTKNGEDRTVHLNPSLVQTLINEKSKRIVFSKYVFPDSTGRGPADIKTAWELALKEANFKGESVCFHTLRHTVGTHLALRGHSPLEIAAVLGHKTLAMVKRYSHLTTSSTAKALDKLNDELFRLN